jgi:hypothetical protein
VVAEAREAFEESVRLFPNSTVPIFGHDELEALLAAVRVHERAVLMGKWLHDGQPLTNDDFIAIKLRWSTGPEHLQHDADALICAVSDLRNAARAVLTAPVDERAKLVNGQALDALNRLIGGCP